MYLFSKLFFIPALHSTNGVNCAEPNTREITIIIVDNFQNQTNNKVLQKDDKQNTCFLAKLLVLFLIKINFKKMTSSVQPRTRLRPK